MLKRTREVGIPIPVKYSKRDHVEETQVLLILIDQSETTTWLSNCLKIKFSQQQHGRTLWLSRRNTRIKLYDDFVPIEFIHDRELVLKVLCDNLSKFSDNLRAVPLSISNLYNNLPLKLQTDQQVLLEFYPLMKWCSRYLKNLNSMFVLDAELLRCVLWKNPFDFYRFLNDSPVKQDPGRYWKQMARDLNYDIIGILNKDDGFKYDVDKDRDFILECMRNNPLIYYRLGRDFIEELELKQIAEKCLWELFPSPELIIDRELAIQKLKVDGTKFIMCNHNLQNDKEIVWIAMNSFPQAILKSPLKKDKQFVVDVFHAMIGHVDAPSWMIESVNLKESDRYRMFKSLQIDSFPALIRNSLPNEPKEDGYYFLIVSKAIKYGGYLYITLAPLKIFLQTSFIEQVFEFDKRIVKFIHAPPVRGRNWSLMTVFTNYRELLLSLVHKRGSCLQYLSYDLMRQPEFRLAALHSDGYFARFSQSHFESRMESEYFGAIQH